VACANGVVQAGITCWVGYGKPKRLPLGQPKYTVDLRYAGIGILKATRTANILWTRQGRGSLFFACFLMQGAAGCSTVPRVLSLERRPDACTRRARDHP
jgi:hypothetical protein